MLPSNTAVLCHYEGSFFDPYNCEPNVFYTYNKQKVNSLSVFQKFCRKYDFLTNFVSLGYNKAWVCKVKDFDFWLLLDSNREMECLARFIKHHNKKAKVFYISIDCGFPLTSQKYCDGAVCWDPIKAKEWNARFLPLFFYYKPIISTSSKKYSYIWLGREKKERNNELLEAIHKELNSCFGENESGFWLTLKSGDKGLRYVSEYLPLVNNSNIIVEIVREDQCGLTLRTLEALFYNKKLITTNKNVMDYDFYNKTNIFIYGVDKNLEEWCKIPGVNVSEDIKNQYTVESFINAVISV